MDNRMKCCRYCAEVLIKDVLCFNNMYISKMQNVWSDDSFSDVGIEVCQSLMSKKESIALA